MIYIKIYIVFSIHLSACGNLRGYSLKIKGLFINLLLLNLPERAFEYLNIQLVAAIFTQIVGLLFTLNIEPFIDLFTIITFKEIITA